MAAPSEQLVATVRGWLLLALGAALIVHGSLTETFAEIGFGFSLLGVEPLARAHQEVR